jgi:hypothetical protein
VKCDTLINSHSILNWWKNTYQLLNTHGVKDVRQNEINTAEPLGTQPSASKAETVIKRLKIYKLPHTDQILAEMIPTRGRAVHSEVHKHTNCTWNKKEFQQ